MKPYVLILKNLKKAKTRKGRKTILSYALRDDEFKRIVLYTLNPLWDYGITTYRMEPESEYGTALDFFVFLDELRERHITDIKAELMAGEYAKLNSDLEIILQHILKRDLECGVDINLVNEVYPGLLPSIYKHSNTH